MAIEDDILRILARSKLSLTIDDVSARAGISRLTASKYLAVLEARGLLARRDVGRAKLFEVKRR